MDPLSKRSLGKTGVEVTILGFGGGMLGRAAENEALRTVEAAYDAGLNLFDTAPHYGQGLSEVRMGAVLRQKSRETYVLSTKVGRYLLPPSNEFSLDRSPDAKGLDFNEVFDYSRDGTLRAIDQSMARLGISSIDCLLIHDVDVWSHGSREAYLTYFKQSMDECYPVLDDLRKQGVIKAVGVGVNEVDVCMDFTRAGDFDFFDLAGRYTLLEQGGLGDFLPLCLERNIGIMLGGPYNSGILATGAKEGAKYNYNPARPEILDAVQRIEAVCARYSVPLAAAALQFPLGHPSVTSVIPGTDATSQVERNIGWMLLDIPADLWAELKHEGLLHRDAPVPGF
jgi:D-threo-aldose 1-dehydrogenase